MFRDEAHFWLNSTNKIVAIGTIRHRFRSCSKTSSVSFASYQSKCANELSKNVQNQWTISDTAMANISKRYSSKINPKNSLSNDNKLSSLNFKFRELPSESPFINKPASITHCLSLYFVYTLKCIFKFPNDFTLSNFFIYLFIFFRLNISLRDYLLKTFVIENLIVHRRTEDN